jgi:hypothetical protein
MPPTDALIIIYEYRKLSVLLATEHKHCSHPSRQEVGSVVDSKEGGHSFLGETKSAPIEIFNTPKDKETLSVTLSVNPTG